MPVKTDNLYEGRKFNKVELLNFMYGALLVRLTINFKEIKELNTKIENIGQEMGKRLLDDLIDDFEKKLIFLILKK